MAKWPSVTFTAKIPACGSLVEPSALSSRTPAGSGTTVQRAPAGIEPIGWPVASSVRISSPPPSPPRVTLGRPAASPMRSSGSVPIAGAAGRAHAARAAMPLASQRLPERRVERRDRMIDIRIRVCAGDEPRFERRRREENPALEGRPVPAGEKRGVGALRLSEVPHRARGEVHAPQGAGVTHRDRYTVPAGGVPYTRDQLLGSALQRIVET